MDFDTPLDRTGTCSNKWDDCARVFGVDPDAGGLPMWVADSDFHTAPPVQRALERMVAHGVYGYPTNFEDDYLAAVAWWMRTRHGWTVEPDQVLTNQGLVNGIALAMAALTEPGDGVVIFPPVYHAFAGIIRAGGRAVVNCPLAAQDGRVTFDFDAYDAQMTGREKLAILCSPHNPGGQVWTRGELDALAAFCRRHDLILLSDEIHHDLVYPGATHIPMTHIDGIADRLVMLTSPSKTFNIAGNRMGQTIIPDDALRARVAPLHKQFTIRPTLAGYLATTAAYSAEGATWTDAQVAYLDGNRALFEDGVGALPGVRVQPLQSTYLAWVDFAGTGMEPDEVIARVQTDARIAASPGASFGPGGETFLRFNLATQRARVAEAVERLRAAFSDLQ